MRTILAILVAGLACAAFAGAEPTGEDFYSILFANLDHSLADEELCKIKVWGPDGTSRPATLGEHLSSNLFSIFHQDRNVTTLRSECDAAQWESEGKVVDVWDCVLSVLEETREGEFIASGSVLFSVPRDGEKRMLPGSLRCS